MEAGQSGVESARRQGMKEGAARTLAQSFCLVVGIVLVAVGVLGFIFGGPGAAAFTVGDGPAAGTFIVFDVNAWHNIVHLATGAFLVFMAAAPATAITGALVFGVVYVIVAVWGFIDTNDVASIVPINAPDNWLHVALGVLGLVVGISAGGLAGSARRGAPPAE